MKKLLITLLAISVIAGICVATCPDKKQHAEAVATIFDKTINEHKTNKQSLAAKKATLNIVKTALESLISVDNYYVFNVGKITQKDEKVSVTFGILNNVFILNEELFTGKKI